MDIYIERHKKMEEKLKVATRDTQKIAAGFLLSALDDVENANNNQVVKTQVNLEKTFVKMYDNINSSILDFGEDMVIDNVKWESNIHGVPIEKYDDILLKLFGGVLISKHSLKNWLKKAAYKDTQKLMGIVRKSIINDTKEKDVKAQVLDYYKTPMNTIRGLMDAVAFSSLFLVRDKVLKNSKTEIIQWVSILDSGTTKGCIQRDGLLYSVKNKEPHGHFTEWKEPGVYHWGCRSFVIPYKNK